MLFGKGFSNPLLCFKGNYMWLAISTLRFI